MFISSDHSGQHRLSISNNPWHAFANLGQLCVEKVPSQCIHEYGRESSAWLQSWQSVSFLDLGSLVDWAECQSDRRHERSERTGTMINTDGQSTSANDNRSAYELSFLSYWQRFSPFWCILVVHSYLFFLSMSICIQCKFWQRRGSCAVFLVLVGWNKIGKSVELDS